MEAARLVTSPARQRDPAAATADRAAYVAVLVFPVLVLAGGAAGYFFAPTVQQASGWTNTLLGLVMFGMVAATGIRVLSRVDFAANRHNLFVVAVSLGMGMIPMIAGNFDQWLPASTKVLTHSGILLAAVSAVGLNWFFNGARQLDRAELSRAAAQADAH